MGGSWVRWRSAELLSALAPVYGVELALGGPPPEATAAVTLIDDGTESHSFDAEGTGGSAS